MPYSLSMADTEPSGGAVVPADNPGEPGNPDNPGAPGGPGELRASHADRDQVAEQLRIAAGDGRLSPEELDERLELALTARTYAELAALIADLPATGMATSPAVLAAAALSAGAAPEPKDLIRLHYTSGSARRDGRWVVPARMDLKTTSGSILLDFTEAVITRPTLHIDAEVRSGAITLIIKPGIVVEADDVSVRSGFVKVRAPWGDDVPVQLRIDIAGSCGSGAIIARPPRGGGIIARSSWPPRPPRRSFWQWLRRVPRQDAIAPGR